MKAPEHYPKEMEEGYSMNGQVPIEYSYRDDCSDNSQQEYNQNYTKEKFEKFTERIRNRKTHGYGQTDLWMYEALEKYPILDKTVCIVGSTAPWYEAMAIEFGARKCTVFEYSKREVFNEKIEYIQPHEIGKEQYDVCFSISSIEHDGLGRYGDPLNPDGDLEAMSRAKEYIKKDGLMFLAVPTGYDVTYFNVHRVYGRQRLPLLLKDWKKIDAFGIYPNTLKNNFNDKNQSPYQPVFILKNV